MTWAASFLLAPAPAPAFSPYSATYYLFFFFSFFLGLFVDNDEIPTMILAYDAYDACRILLTLIQRFQGYKKYPVEWVGD